jgi:hypothetical protein
MLSLKFADHFPLPAHTGSMIDEQKSTTGSGYWLLAVGSAGSHAPRPRFTVHVFLSPCSLVPSFPVSLLHSFTSSPVTSVPAFLTTGHCSLTTGLPAFLTTNHYPPITVFLTTNHYPPTAAFLAPLLPAPCSLAPCSPRSLAPCSPRSLASRFSPTPRHLQTHPPIVSDPHPPMPFCETVKLWNCGTFRIRGLRPQFHSFTDSQFHSFGF